MIRITVVHEIALVCHTLVSVLREEPDIEIVGVASNLEDAIDYTQNGRCDVLLLNAGDHCPDLLRFIHETNQRNQHLKVLVVGIIKAEEYILQCFQAGAVGYLLHDDSLEDLKHKIRAAHRGEAFISPRIASALVSLVAKLTHLAIGSREDRYDLPLLRADLTRRERDVLIHIEQGWNNQEIAEALVIEVGTVKSHVHNILKKLNVDNRERAAMLARQFLPMPQFEPIYMATPPTPTLTYNNVSYGHRRKRVPA